MTRKDLALKYTIGISLFAILGILIAVIFPGEGIGILAPLLMGPGITILLFGILYDSSIGPFFGFSDDKLTQKIKYAYMGLGGLFALMGFFIWAFA
jgi:hypothetical protein